MENRPLILIIDDNQTNLKLLSSVLKKYAFTVEEALSGKKAIELLATIKPDLILLDVLMPEMDGFATCSNIKSNPEWKDIPVLFISAFDQIDQMIRGIQCGALDYILKPFQPELLISKINIHLSLKFKTEELALLNKTLESKVEERTRELHNANIELTKLDEIKTEFLRIISHEIRTPLNAIMGFTKLIKKNEGNPTTQKYVTILESSIQRLVQFSLNALQFTQLKAKGYEMNVVDVNLLETINSSIRLLKNSLEDKNLSISISIDADFKIRADQELILKCFQYIIDNAIKYSSDNSIIVISSEKNEQGALVRFMDYGTGFSEKAISNLFKPFVPGEDFVNENEGLELCICKLIMDNHKGEIHIENLLQGAMVTLFFKHDL